MNGALHGALWVGVDLGTQSVKVTIVDDDGVCRAESSLALDSIRSPGRHEQNPVHWVDRTADAMGAAVASLAPGLHGRIRAVAVCSTSGTLAVLGADGAPTMPGLMYDDARAASLADEIRDAAPELWSSLGYRIQPSWAVCKMVWLARRNLIGAVDRIVHQNDVVAEAMTGAPVASDWSSALKSGYDLLSTAWPASVLDRLGVPVPALPDVVAPGSVVGHTSAAWAERTGLPAGTQVVSGMTDGCAAQLGAGALGIGDWHTVLGTTLVLKGVSDRPVADESGAVYSHRAPHDDLWLPGGASSVGAGVLSDLLPDADLDALAALANGQSGPYPLSYPLTGRGERFPIVRPDAEGFVINGGAPAPLGDLLASGPVNTVRGVFAGVACVERLCFDMLAARGAPLNGRLTSSGGGTRSLHWTRMRASMLERSIALPASAEASLGMAILAAWGAGAGAGDRPPLPAVARRMSRVASVVDPDPVESERLQDHYGQFTQTLTKLGWITA